MSSFIITAASISTAVSTCRESTFSTEIPGQSGTAIRWSSMLPILTTTRIIRPGSMQAAITIATSFMWSSVTPAPARTPWSIAPQWKTPEFSRRPWTIEALLYRHQEKNFRVMEYECQMFKEKLVREGKGNNLKVVESN